MFRHFACPWCDEDLPIAEGRQMVKRHLVKCILLAQAKVDPDPNQLTIEEVRELHPEVPDGEDPLIDEYREVKRLERRIQS